MVCSGTQGAPALEDSFLAGFLVCSIREQFIAQNISLNRDAQDSQKLFYGNKEDILGFLEKCPNSEYLRAIGKGSDILDCSLIDKKPILARMSGQWLEPLPGGVF